MRSGITRKWRRKRWGSSFKFVRANPAAPGHAGNAGCLHSCQYRLLTPTTLAFPTLLLMRKLLLQPLAWTCAESSRGRRSPFAYSAAVVLPLFLRVRAAPGLSRGAGGAVGTLGPRVHRWHCQSIGIYSTVWGKQTGVQLRWKEKQLIASV